jgi:hypothetical protein
MKSGGMIIAAENKRREFTQDDIILYDETLCPPVLASNNAPEGVFLFNSVIARIEVKSELTRSDIKNFVESSVEISNLQFSVRPDYRPPDCKEGVFGPFNLLFAFDSDAGGKGKPDYELERLCAVMKECGVDPMSGIVSSLCLPRRVFWKIGPVGDDKRVWQRLNSKDVNDHLV